jgi:hypothetical protein
MHSVQVELPYVRAESTIDSISTRVSRLVGLRVASLAATTLKTVQCEEQIVLCKLTAAAFYK